MFEQDNRILPARGLSYTLRHSHLSATLHPKVRGALGQIDSGQPQRQHAIWRYILGHLYSCFQRQSGNQHGAARQAFFDQYPLASPTGMLLEIDERPVLAGQAFGPSYPYCRRLRRTDSLDDRLGIQHLSAP